MEGTGKEEDRTTEREGEGFLLDGGRRLYALDMTGGVPTVEFTEWLAMAIMKFIDARFRDPEVQKDFLRWKAERIAARSRRIADGDGRMERAGARLRSLIEWPSLWECWLYMDAKGIRNAIVEFQGEGTAFVPKPRPTEIPAFF